MATSKSSPPKTAKTPKASETPLPKGSPTAPKLGRPPASSSAETRGRIVDVARRCFADQGFEATTNRSLAQEAGITTGAIYHYFESKLDIFVAVEAEVQSRVYIRFRSAERAADTFIGKVEAVLETAHELNREDSSLAQFIGSSRVDRRRFPELRRAVASKKLDNSADFFNDIVAFGVESGEVKAKDAPLVLSLLYVITVGLTDAVSNDLAAHRMGVDALKALLGGELLTPPS